MMMPPDAQGSPHKRIVVASPIEPSGASWLLNCFLELGIRIDHKPAVERVWRGSVPPPDSGRMWIARDEGRVALNPKAGVLMKFLPALVRRAEFRFRDDVSVEYVQDLPCRRLDERLRVLVVRDPRDAIYSSFRRNDPALTFPEFLSFRNPYTLLDRSANWALFVAAWLALPDIHVVRFEDYKQDANRTLRAVLAKLGLAFDDCAIADAVQRSSFERARDAENAIARQFPNDRQVANRSGKVGEGREHAEVREVLPEIERKTATLLRALGYAGPVPAGYDDFAEARVSAAFLGFFDTVHLPAAIASAPWDLGASQDIVCALLAFAHRLDRDLLIRAALPPAETRALLDSLAGFTLNHAAWLAQRLQTTRSNFGDGSSYFFEQIKQMRESRRAGPATAPPATSR
jgi:hypothetical protein